MGELGNKLRFLLSLFCLVISCIWAYEEFKKGEIAYEALIAIASACWVAIEANWVVSATSQNRPNPSDENLARDFFTYFDDSMIEFLLGPWAPSISDHNAVRLFEINERWADERRRFSERSVEHRFEALRSSIRVLSRMIANRYHSSGPGRSQIMIPAEELYTDLYSRESSIFVNEVESAAEDVRQQVNLLHPMLVTKFPEVYRDLSQG